MLEVRTDVDVVLDMVKDGVPGETFPHESFIEVLQARKDYSVTKNMVYSVVRKTNERLQQEYARTLAPVRRVGYRVLYAHESVPHAKRHERKAINQITAGSRVLRHTRTSELDDEQRKTLEDLQIRMSNIEAMMVSHDRKMSRHERDIEHLKIEQHTSQDAMQMMMQQMLDRIEKLEEKN